MTEKDRRGVLEEAIFLAASAHAGEYRKLADIPAILHPMEVAVIASTMTADPEVLAAALLHDTVEDTDTTPDMIRAACGERVARLVASETENRPEGVSPEASWKARKEESLKELAACQDRDVKILWLSDKLSNIRSIARKKKQAGDAIWMSFHERDPREHEWYYTAVRDLLREFEGTEAYTEYCALIDTVFGGMTHG